MAASTIIYILSVVASLYATYLLAYCLYDVPYSEKYEPKRIILPRIAYIAFLIVSFIPGLNFLFVLAFLIGAILFKATDQLQIKSWLFEKPDVKADNTDDNPEKK